jgi:hypothetical protein
MSDERTKTNALTPSQPQSLTRGSAALVRRGLDSLKSRQTVPKAVGRRIVTILYASADQVMDEAFHGCATQALAGSCDIVPVWESNERDIRLLWKQTDFDCAVLVLNNIHLDNVVGAERYDAREVLSNALALIQWLRDHGSATIIASSGLRQPGLEEEARRNGADGFFYLPFPPLDFEKLLRDRFAQDWKDPW